MEPEDRCPACGALVMTDEETGTDYCSELDECGWDEVQREGDLDEEEDYGCSHS